MHSKSDIRIKVEETIRSIFFSEENDDRVLLHIILSNSFHAISLVSLLEDEFDIIFDDDEINLDFFQSINHIVELIYQHLSRVGLGTFTAHHTVQKPQK